MTNQRLFLGGVAVVCLFSCAQDPEEPGRLQGAVTASPPTLLDREEVRFPADRYLTWTNTDHPHLPKWKTEWERELERLSQAGGPGGSPLLDQYDSYRLYHASKFHITQPPATPGIRPPAEYEPSQAYLLSWAKYSQSAWKKLFGSIVKGAWGVVPVLMLYKDQSHLSYLVAELKALGFSTAELQDPQNIVFYQQSTNAIWARDFGPLSIVTPGTPKLSFVDFRYYHARPYDDEIPADLAKDWGINDFRPDLEFEGGNFMSTSDGLCAATKGVLHHNLQYSQSAVEQIFKDYLGCKETVLTATMSGGVIAHIDMFAKFASDTAVLVGEYQASQDPTNKAILDANAALFAGRKTPSGKTISVTRIPMPSAGGGMSKTWRTYTNSLSLVGAGGGKVVLIPVYSDETTHEAAALAAYAKVYPGWKLVPIDAKVIIPDQGAIHCITMQIPVGARSKMEADPADLCGPTSIQCATKACGAITTQGCCDGELLKYCSQGTLKAVDCTTKPKCGWHGGKQYYVCGTTGAPDPSGTFPMPCPGSVAKDSGPPVVKDSAPPVVKDSGPPVVKDSTPPQVKDSAPPQVKDSAPPQVKDSGPPATQDSAPSTDVGLPPTDSAGQGTTDSGAGGDATRAAVGDGGCACAVEDRTGTPSLVLVVGLLLLRVRRRMTARG